MCGPQANHECASVDACPVIGIREVESGRLTAQATGSARRGPDSILAGPSATSRGQRSSSSNRTFLLFRPHVPHTPREAEERSTISTIIPSRQENQAISFDFVAGGGHFAYFRTNSRIRGSR